LGCERPRAFAVEYHPNALKDLSKLDKPVARRIVNAVDALKVNPRPNGARPLAGYPELWRIRVGDYRVVYTIRDAELLILALRVRHRSNVYRGM
jgi:mRNA interferase RelE/StbE